MRKPNLLLIGALVVGVLLALIAVVWSIEQLRWLALPPLEPLPPYLAVHPAPGQTARLSDPAGYIVISGDDASSTVFNIPVHQEPGYVCVVLNAADLLVPGAFWDASDINELSSLTIDGVRPAPSPEAVDGALLTELIVDGETVAQAGGPYGMCWQGPRRVGYHSAEFHFQSETYTWWYRVDE